MSGQEFFSLAVGDPGVKGYTKAKGTVLGQGNDTFILFLLKLCTLPLLKLQVTNLHLSNRQVVFFFFFKTDTLKVSAYSLAEFRCC